MMAVIFELEPKSKGTERYFELAHALKDALTHIDGFISIERFQSLSQPGRYLSLSFWRDEEAIKAWRNLDMHRAAQAEGRNRLFIDYRLRVVQVVRDYGPLSREQAPDELRHRLR